MEDNKGIKGKKKYLDDDEEGVGDVEGDVDPQDIYSMAIEPEFSANDEFSASLYALIVDYKMDETMALIALENSGGDLNGALEWLMTQQRAASTVGETEVGGARGGRSGYDMGILGYDSSSDEGEANVGAFAGFNDDTDSEADTDSSCGEGEGGGSGSLVASTVPTIAKLPAPPEVDEEAVLDAVLDAYILENQQLLASVAGGLEGAKAEEEEEDLDGRKLPPRPPPIRPNSSKPNSDKKDIHSRLQSKLIAKGITPSSVANANEGEDSDASISMGKTLMQQVLEAGVNEIESRLAELRAHEREHRLLNKEMNKAKGNSKAMAGQYVRKQDVADNSRKRENIHHAGSHYHMAASKGMQRNKQQGLMARHSAQGSRLQASRMASRAGLANMMSARDAAKGVIGGEKKGKTGKKSSQKKKGEAGGSKKGRGNKGGGGGGVGKGGG